MGIYLNSGNEACQIFLRQSGKEQEVPFITSRNVPNTVTQAAMDAAEQNKDMHGPFDRIDALMEALNA